jgi:hypothetical protein
MNKTMARMLGRDTTHPLMRELSEGYVEAAKVAATVPELKERAERAEARVSELERAGEVDPAEVERNDRTARMRAWRASMGYMVPGQLPRSVTPAAYVGVEPPSDDDEAVKTCPTCGHPLPPGEIGLGV